MQNQNNRVLSRTGARLLTEEEVSRIKGAAGTLCSATGGIHGTPSDIDCDK
jgi:hypothetical protein